jgi:hypothetical protein
MDSGARFAFCKLRNYEGLALLVIKEQEQEIPDCFFAQKVENIL